MRGQYGQNGQYEWNFYDRMEDGHLTNNAAEGANNRLSIRCRTAHPGIYQFFGVLKKELKTTMNKMEQYEAATLHFSQTTRARTIQKSRLKLKAMLEDRQLTLRKYLRSQGVLNMKIKSSRNRRVPQHDGGDEREPVRTGLPPSLILIHHRPPPPPTHTTSSRCTSQCD